LIYDSRKRVRFKGEEYIAPSRIFTRLEAGLEIASPDLAATDFNFIKYYARAKHTGRILLPDVSTVEGFIGGSEKDLPPQRYFTIDFTYNVLDEGMSFKTLGGNNFVGSRVVAVYLSHDFGRWLFQKSSLPFIKTIPLSLSIYGGAFWADFKNNTPQLANDPLKVAPSGYSEVGFSLGRIPPMSLRVDFTWQLSTYDTHHFWFTFGFVF
jgi:hypothetical protein